MSTPYYTDEEITLHHGDCLDVLRAMPDASVDAVVTDPPYGLEFMGKEWDGADGFRRSLNPADAERDNAFGRTSRTSPEYRTASKAQASRRQEGGISQATGPSFLGGLNPKCLECDKWQRGSNPCSCEAPRFTNERLPRLHSFQEWCEAWSRECLRVLRPGGHLLAFGGTRTHHRLACAIEDAGFEIRDSIAWLYGSGFPKSLDVSKAIDKAAGAERVKVQKPGAASAYSANAGNDRPWMQLAREQGFIEVDGDEPATPDAERWQGWGTALKPAHEPIVVARKPLAGTVAANVLAHGTGALNIDGCRVGFASAADEAESKTKNQHADFGTEAGGNAVYGDYSMVPRRNYNPTGRWPANVILDESQAEALDEQSGERRAAGDYPSVGSTGGYGGTVGLDTQGPLYSDTGGASRFFYVAKADAGERVRVNGTAHPTVKPLALMRWLVRLVTPPGGLVLEPFAGSGTTVEACILEGFHCIAIEREADYLPLIRQRVHRRRDPVAAVKAVSEDGGLFDLLGEEPA